MLTREAGYLELACPGCGRAAPRDPQIHSEPRAESLEFEGLQSYWRGFFKDRVFFSYHRCGGCGLLFCPRFFNEEQMRSLYRDMPDNMAEVPQELLRRTQRRYFELFRGHARLSGEYLELGPDVGLFTELCAREGSFSRLWLFEPNSAVHGELRSRVGKVPSEVFPAMFEPERIPGPRITAAAMIHVLDHVLDPKGLLSALRTRLAPEATLLLVTHDESSWLARLLGRRWVPYCLQHPQLFNPRTLSALLSGSGYEVVRIDRSVNDFPAEFLLRQLFWALGAGRLPEFRIPLPALPLRLGNIATIARPARSA